MKEGDHLVDLRVDDKIILKLYLQETIWKDVDCFTLVQHRDERRAIVNTILSFSFHKTRKISWLLEEMLASQEGLCWEVWRWPWQTFGLWKADRSLLWTINWRIIAKNTLS
jgi:hypothetical protein